MIYFAFQRTVHWATANAGGVRKTLPNLGTNIPRSMARLARGRAGGRVQFEIIARFCTDSGWINASETSKARMLMNGTVNVEQERLFHEKTGAQPTLRELDSVKAITPAIGGPFGVN